MPDGIRKSNARHILIEFKATESLSKDALTQAAAYEYFYKRSQKLTDDEIQIFVICSMQPQKANREQYGYTIQLQPGVYQSEQIAFNHITLISLNELADELHNAWIACVASKKLKRLKAFNILNTQGFNLISMPFKKFLIVLWRNISTKGDDDMALTKLSIQDIEEMIKMWGKDSILSTFSTEERLNGLKPEERLMGLKPEEQLIGLKPEERLMGLKPEERLMGLKPEEQLIGLKPEEQLIGLKPEEQLIGLKPEERLMGLKPEERLAGLPFSELEELEECIKKLKQKE